MKKLTFAGIILLTTCCRVAYAQAGSGAVYDFSNAQQFMNDANGRPLSMHSDYLVEGSPFYADEYCTANLKVRNGKKYTGIRVKVNLQDNRVIYDMGNGKEMEATSPIEKIEFFNCNDPRKNRVLVNSFPAIDGHDESSYYVMLDSGNVTLLKYTKVDYRDTRPYGSAATTRVFEQHDLFYVYTPGKGISKLGKDPESVLASLPNKKTEVSKFIAANDIRCRKEEDLVRVFYYYNSL